MNTIMYIKNKYNILLKSNNHISLNKTYYGRKLDSTQRVFVKEYCKESLYKKEKIIYESIAKDNIIFNDYYKGKYILCLKYKDYKDFDWDDDADLALVAKKIALFHSKLDNILIDKFKITSIYDLLENKYNKVANEVSDNINILYNIFKDKKKNIQDEERQLPFVLLHGDFSKRNIKRLNCNIELIDFERVYIHSAWCDFVKLFRNELKVPSKQAKFLSSYRLNKELKPISANLYNLFEFIELLGIKYYTKKINSLTLMEIGTNIENDLKKYYNIANK